MSKKMVKGLSILAIVTFLLMMVTGNVFAADSSFLDPSTIKPTESGASTAAQSISGTILAVVQVVGVAVAVIMLVVLAIKYISAAPNDKAEIKKHAVVYVVGAIVLFAASGILGIIRGFATQIDEAGNSAIQSNG